MIYGATNSQYHEPVDQVAAFLVAKDVQERHPEVSFLPLAVGRFSILDARSGESLTELERELQLNALHKQWLHAALMDYLRLKGTIFITDNFWDDTRHWDIVAEILEETPSIIPEKKHSMPRATNSPV